LVIKVKILGIAKNPRFRRAHALAACLSLLLPLALPLAASGAAAALDIQPRSLRVGEAAILTVTVRGAQNAPTPSLPNLPGFQSSFMGTQRSFTMGTGGTESSLTYRYQLLPLQAGKFTIGPFPYTVDGETLNLAGVEIEVLAPEASQNETSQSQQISDLIFAVLTASPSELYNQQVFDIYLSIYSRGLNLSSDISLMNMPSSGLSLKQFQELPGTREVVRNQIYEVRRFQCKAQALTAGSFKLQPTIRVGVRIQDRRRAQDQMQGAFDDPFFDSFFGRVRTQPVDITTKPLELNVADLPADTQPSGFAGAVGNFSFDAFVKPTDVAVGEPLTLTMRITGSGNIESVTAPEIPVGDGFKLYDSKLAQRDFNEQQSEGRKIFEQVMIPKSADITEVPAIAFTYFDPSSRSYQTIKKGPFPLAIHAASNTAARLIQPMATSPNTSTIMLGTDIVYLKSAPARWRHVSARPWYTSTLFLGLQAFPPLILGILYASVRRREELQRDVAKARRQKAPKVARDALRRVEDALKSGNRTAFFEAIWETLAAYFGNRLNLSPGEITADTAGSAFIGLSTSGELMKDIRSLFAACEQARFGSSATGQTALSPEESRKMKELLDMLYRTLRACERIRL